MNFYSIWILVVTLFIGKTGFSQPKPDWTTPSPITITNNGIQNIPLKITPIYLEITPKEKVLSVMHALDNQHSLDGLPIKIYDFPILNLNPGQNNLAGSWLEFDIADQLDGQNLVKSKLKIGDPKLFPELLEKRIDLSSEVFVPRTKSYQLIRALKLGTPTNWRFVSIGSEIINIDKGIAQVIFPPGGALVLQKSFSDLDLTKTPILSYECELPDDANLEIQINAKISKNRFTTQLIPLFSSTIRGSGKQKLLIDFLDLLKKVDPDAEQASLEELYLQFRSNSNWHIPRQVVSIQLGSLEFYHSARDADQYHEILIPLKNLDGQVDLSEKLSKELFNFNQPALISAKLVNFKSDSTKNEGPKISFQANHNYNIPKFFIGDKLFLNDLSEFEFNELLEQKLFVESEILWDAKLAQNNIQFIKPNIITQTFPVDLNVEENFYLKVNYPENQKPKLVSLTGIDKQNHQFTYEYNLAGENHIKINPMHLKFITMSFHKDSENTFKANSTELENPIQIIRIKKNTIYKPITNLTQFKLDGIELGNIIWHINPQVLNVNLLTNYELKTLITFQVDRIIEDNTNLVYNLISPGETSIENKIIYFLRIKGIANNSDFEQLFQIENNGVFTLPKGKLSNIEILAKSSTTPVSTDIYLKHLIIQNSLFINTTLSFDDIVNGGKKIELIKPELQENIQKIEYNSFGSKTAQIDVDHFALQEKLYEQHSNIKNIDLPQPTAWDFLFKILKILIVCMFIYFIFKYAVSVISKIDRNLNHTIFFWTLEAILFPTSLFKMFKGTTSTEFSIGAIIFILFYCIALRYKLRPYLSKRWVIFKERLSAPYFIVALSFLFACATSLSLGLNTAAEKLAAIVYYFMIVGVVVEFISFTRDVEATEKD